MEKKESWGIRNNEGMQHKRWGVPIRLWYYEFERYSYECSYEYPLGGQCQVSHCE